MTALPTYVENLERIVRGGRYTPTVFSDGSHNWRRWEGQFAANCQAPVRVEQNARPSKRGQREVTIPRDGMSLTVVHVVPCRKCEACLKRRAAHWRLRALAEYRACMAVDARTWFSTLTISPEWRFRVLTKLRSNVGYKRDRIAGEPLTLDFDALSPDEQFREKHREISKEITRYLKRVRTNSGSVFRFLCVTERHEGGGDSHGEPHYHMLLHETRIDQAIRERVLSDAWRWGFSQHRLVKSPRQAVYLCKYLSKASIARVRASGAYGESTA